jgi:hypothetical protein
MLRATQGLQHIIYGAVLVLCLLFVPDGLASISRRLNLRIGSLPTLPSTVVKRS